MNIDYKENIRQNLTLLREKTGLSNAEIAQRCGVSKPTVTNWFNGRNSIDKKYLLPLSEMFNISLDALMGPPEEMGRHLSDYKKQAVKAAATVSKDQAYYNYVHSLGLEMYQDDPEHKPFLLFEGVSVPANYDALEKLKTRIDARARTVIQSVIYDLIDEEDAKRTEESKRLREHIFGNENKEE